MMTPQPAIHSSSGSSPAATGLNVPEDACCLRCGYSLRGLTEARCPECGQAFSREQFNMFQPRWPGMLLWVLPALLIPAIVSGIASWPMLRWSVKDGGLFGRYLANAYCIPGLDWRL